MLEILAISMILQLIKISKYERYLRYQSYSRLRRYQRYQKLQILEILEILKGLEILEIFKISKEIPNMKGIRGIIHIIDINYNIVSSNRFEPLQKCYFRLKFIDFFVFTKMNLNILNKHWATCRQFYTPFKWLFCGNFGGLFPGRIFRTRSGTKGLSQQYICQVSM